MVEGEGAAVVGEPGHGLSLQDVTVTTAVPVTTVTPVLVTTGAVATGAWVDEESPPNRPPIQPRMPPPEEEEAPEEVGMGDATRVMTEPVTTGAGRSEPVAVGMGMMLPLLSMVPGEPWYRVFQSTVLTKSSDQDWGMAMELVPKRPSKMLPSWKPPVLEGAEGESDRVTAGKVGRVKPGPVLEPPEPPVGEPVMVAEGEEPESPPSEPPLEAEGEAFPVLEPAVGTSRVTEVPSRAWRDDWKPGPLSTRDWEGPRPPLLLLLEGGASRSEERFSPQEVGEAAHDNGGGGRAALGGLLGQQAGQLAEVEAVVGGQSRKHGRQLVQRHGGSGRDGVDIGQRHSECCVCVRGRD
ncbi:uncharacterized protein YALI1_C22986g [Yarrowia lipolytica]|uniref:Uncharacterized protein n=1 Tax=Yarrowia lipolytica TaxID=4952 RepID=A0A1D8NBC6_YARLL|nr:hypothetical protein YALI1_C22986g [Yarrowia lipolytica]